MVEKFKTLSGDFYVGMKLSDCKTDAQRKEFQRINKLDGKIQQVLSGEDICRERDSETDKRQKVALGITAASYIAVETGVLAPEGLGGFIVGTALGIWNMATYNNTNRYKEENNIKYKK